MVDARTRALPIAITAIATLAVTLGLADCGPSHCQRIADIQQLRPAVRDYPQDWPQGSMTIAVVGDVQRTSFQECVIGREVNDEEQAVLIADMAAQAPKAVVLLGDLVFEGGDPLHWLHFDSVVAPLHAIGTSFFPVFGNHDYQGARSDAFREITARFPNVAKQGTYYTFDWGAVRMIVLDGNRDQLCDSFAARINHCEKEWTQQRDWLQDRLHDLDTPTPGGPRAAILFVHQSPYTRSPLVAGDQKDPRDFLLAFFASTHTLAMISAHAHGYERWHVTGGLEGGQSTKPFLVSAGGGGPRPHKPRGDVPKDEADLPWPRPFNYLLLRQTEAGVDVTVRAVNKGERVVATLENETMHWPMSAAQ